MILVVTLNPAIDVTHHVDGADWAGVNRPHAVTARPGGKGINVARVLHGLGTEVLVTGLAGGLTGDAVRTGLRQAGIPADLSAVAGETRRTFAVADTRRGQTGLFNEPGPEVTGAELAAFRRRYAAALPGCAAVVLSGSRPPGVPDGIYADLAAAAADAGVPAILDTDGPALRAGASGRPAIIKPNLAELERAVGRALTGAAPVHATGEPGDVPAEAERATGRTPTGAAPVHATGGHGEVPAEAERATGRTLASAAPGGTAGGLGAVLAAAAELMAGGAGAVVVSLGTGGLAAVTGDGCWRAAAPAQAAVNPTGAGDAVVAGLARGLELGQDWPERLRHAAALGTAAALAPAAGDVDARRYGDLLAAVRVERLPVPGDLRRGRGAVER